MVALVEIVKTDMEFIWNLEIAAISTKEKQKTVKDMEKELGFLGKALSKEVYMKENGRRGNHMEMVLLHFHNQEK